MLYEIESPPTSENAVIHLHERDNVAIARVPLSAGQLIQVGQQSIHVHAPIPAGHKVAIENIATGAPVRRYGHAIGVAKAPIAAGEHVHTQNLAFTEMHSGEPEPVTAVRGHASSRASFLGYQRADGRTGTRNYIAVVAASNCAAHTAESIARTYEGAQLPPHVDGVIAFPHGEGCGHTIGPDTEQLQRTLAGVLDHPNVSAALILGLGCEVNQISHYLGDAVSGLSHANRLHGLTLQESGGTRAAIEEARRHIDIFIEQAAADKRVEVSASQISLGLNCGGSDSFSGITANPALGVCCDLIVEQGGTVVLAETTEIFGAEQLLAARARNPEVARKLLECVARYKAYLRQFEGSSFNDNPSPGNKEGGLTNIIEKSLGAVAKAGASTLEDVVRYAERIRSRGFVFMDTPGYDPVSITGLAAGGVNLIAFTTGRGSAIGFPSVPVLKIASNSATYNRMRDNMDVNAGRIAEGARTVEQVGREIFDKLLAVASGERTRAELLGHHEFAPWRIGPVL
ncbi:MAG TPA: altronate dehydratase family protein [Bryobacteraceae bacterium]|nr:altronate dehydratase family protein [Bryobacteraceae bacterium]